MSRIPGALTKHLTGGLTPSRGLSPVEKRILEIIRELTMAEVAHLNGNKARILAHLSAPGVTDRLRTMARAKAREEGLIS